MRFAVVLIGLLGAACVEAPPPQHPDVRQLQTRAAFDFSCYEQWLSVHRFDAQSVGVWGCGQRATYVWQCDGACTWRIEPGPTRDTPQPPARSAAAVPPATSTPAWTTAATPEPAPPPARTYPSESDFDLGY